jgi:hypothetical protein
VPPLTGDDRACRAVDPSGFARDPAIRQFAETLANCARSRAASGGALPNRQRADQLSDVAWLERDFADTLRAAQGRWSHCGFRKVARGWMFGRREEVDFATLDTGGRAFNMGALLPPRGGDRLEPLIGKPRDAPVQPLLNRLLRALQSRYSVSINNYSPRHGGGSFSGRGFSVDLYIAGGQDERGFYQRDRAVAMLLALDAAATAVGAEWRVLYNDYAVAAAINRHTGKRRVVFIGSVRPGGTNLNWHGPLILHFHLDITPRRA